MRLPREPFPQPGRPRFSRKRVFRARATRASPAGPLPQVAGCGRCAGTTYALPIRPSGTGNRYGWRGLLRRDRGNDCEHLRDIENGPFRGSVLDGGDEAIDHPLLRIGRSYVDAMIGRFRFALQAQELSDRVGIVALARRAEELGYEELYSYDHVGEVDPFTPLVVAAEATTTLRVGPLVLNNEFHHPALLARTAATVDRLTGGRLVLGIGTGYMQAEHDAIGLELRRPRDRVERFLESLTALRSLLDEGAVTMDGRHHHLTVADLGVRPLQAHVPILVGGHGPRLISAAGRLADIFQFTGLTHGPGGVPQAGGFDIEAVALRAQWLTEAAGERSADIERSVLVQATHIGDGADQAVDRATKRLGVDRELIAASPFLLFGSVEQVIEELESRRDRLGISHVVVRDLEGFQPVVAALAGR